VGHFLLVGKGTIDRQGLQQISSRPQSLFGGCYGPAGGLFLMTVEY